MPGVSSAALNSRPRIGCTRKRGRVASLTDSTSTCSGSPRPVSETSLVSHAPTAFERPLVVEIGEIGGRAVVPASVGHGVEQAHQPIGFVEGQRLQQHAVDDAEDRGRGADAKREGEDGRGREARLLPEHARGVAQVLPEVGDPLPRRRRGCDRRAAHGPVEAAPCAAPERRCCGTRRASARRRRQARSRLRSAPDSDRRGAATARRRSRPRASASQAQRRQPRAHLARPVCPARCVVGRRKFRHVRLR